MLTDGERVGVLMAGDGRWVEIDTDGRLLGQWPVPSLGLDDRVVMTTSGDVYLSTSTRGDGPAPPAYHMARLDRESGEWDLVDLAPVLDPNGPPLFLLHGADGDNLIVTTNHYLSDASYRIARAAD